MAAVPPLQGQRLGLPAFLLFGTAVLVINYSRTGPVAYTICGFEYRGNQCYDQLELPIHLRGS